MRVSFLVLLLAASAVAAQDVTLTFHEAVTDPFADTSETDGMRRDTTISGTPVWVGRTVLTLGYGDVETAGVEADDYGGYIVSLQMAADAAWAFEDLTLEHVGDPIAMVLDGRVLSAPVVQSVISGGHISISGVTLGEAEGIVANLREGLGAQDPAARRREAVDLSTPEGAALAYATALDHADWTTVASVLHPDALRALRESADGSIALVGDSTSLIGVPGATVALADVLGRKPAASRYADLTDADAIALWFAVMHAAEMRWGGNADDLVPVGTVQDGERVHVVLRLPDEGEGDGFSQTATITVKPLGTGLEPSWRALFRVQISAY